MGTIRFTWWNLQNFFDTDDDPISADFEFTGAKGWTPEVFAAKKAKLAEALRSTHDGEEIELLAVAEIEKDRLLEELIEAMGYQHLKVVKDISETSDLRGIDVTLAYDERKLEVKDATSHLVHLRYRTRDIFEVCFIVKDTGEELVVIASHWPSRRLGKFESEPSRIAVADNIAYLVDEHVKIAPARYEELRKASQPEVALQEVRDKWETKVLVIGDFNDEPHDRSVVDHLLASRELDHVVGETNAIDGFKQETADYRGRSHFFSMRPGSFSPTRRPARSSLQAPSRLAR
jgi:endonuclease/exonuclease/phosphatase family metal-dependent hydrolase